LDLDRRGNHLRLGLRGVARREAGGGRGVTFQPDLDALHAGLKAIRAFADVSRARLEPMRTKGLVHAHVRIRGASSVIRAPRLSHWGFEPAAHIAYQAACFERAAASGRTPRLHGVIAPGPGVPFGALIVDEIVGRAPRVPAETAALAGTLAALHTLPVPEGDARAPIPVHDDPVAAIMAVIGAQAAFLPQAGLAPETRRAVEDELGWARRFAAERAGAPHPLALVGTDTHPGNFMVDAHGRAVFVDLEKTVYGQPAIDLAHASLYTSTMWDAECAAALSPAEVRAFYAQYLAAVPRGLADALRPWLEPLRRLTWLRTTTWAMRWRVLHGAEARESDLMASVHARIADYFDPATVAQIRAEWMGAAPLELDQLR
jgi:hypothetical protein